MNTQLKRSMLLPTITNCALTLAGRDVSNLGGEYANGQTLNQPAWPAGMKDLVNAKQRIGGMFVNVEDIFFYSGTAPELNAFLDGQREREALRLETTGSPRGTPLKVPDGNGVMRSGLCFGGSFLDRGPHRAGRSGHPRKCHRW